MSKNLWTTFKETIHAYGEDRLETHAAALSYFTLFAIVPVLLIIVSISAFFLGQENSTGTIHQLISQVSTPEIADSLQKMMESREVQSKSLLATAIGLVTLIFAGTTVFAQLQDSLNHIWKVHRKAGAGIHGILRQRTLSLLMILIIALLSLSSFIASALISGIEKYAADILPGGRLLWDSLNFITTFLLSAVFFGAIYKVLPDISLSWRNVRAGGLITAFLFTVTKVAVGFYLGRSAPASTVGAAGGVILFMLWTHAAAAIFFFGAEFTRCYAMPALQGLNPKEGCEWVPGLQVQTPEISKIKDNARRIKN